MLFLLWFVQQKCWVANRHKQVRPRRWPRLFFCSFFLASTQLVTSGEEWTVRGTLQGRHDSSLDSVSPRTGKSCGGSRLKVAPWWTCTVLRRRRGHNELRDEIASVVNASHCRSNPVAFSRVRPRSCPQTFCLAPPTPRRSPQMTSIVLRLASLTSFAGMRTTCLCSRTENIRYIRVVFTR